MKGGSMNSNDFKMADLPSEDKRPLEGEYKKTILLLYGPSNIGKSTLAELMLNDNFDYISIDRVCRDADIEPIKNFISYMKLSGENINYDLGKLFKYVRENCLVEFVDYFFNKFIVERDYLNIFIEGYLFNLRDLYDLFMKKCTTNNYRIWELKRTL